MTYLLLLYLELLSLLFLGYGIHWCFHREWSGIFFRKHRKHHDILYPPDQFISSKYRDPGSDNSVILFSVAFSPFVLSLLVITIFHIIPPLLGILMLGEMAIVATINNYLHDSFHLEKSIWHRWPGFTKLRQLHLMHHINQSSNYGIFNFWCDRFFGTYKERANG